MGKHTEKIKIDCIVKRYFKKLQLLLSSFIKAIYTTIEARDACIHILLFFPITLPNLCWNGNEAITLNMHIYIDIRCNIKKKVPLFPKQIYTLLA